MKAIDEETKQEEPKEEPKQEQPVENVQPTPTPSPSISEELLGKMVDLCERQSETITNLNARLSQLEESHTQLNREYQSSRPLDVRAEVTGSYDFSKNKETFKSKHYQDEKAYARGLMEKLQNMYPSF